MLDVTTAARGRLLEKLVHKATAEEMALRFTQKPGGWKLRPDEARPGDTTFTHEGRNVLLLDEETSQAMADLVLDVRSTDAGPRLTLNSQEETS